MNIDAEKTMNVLAWVLMIVSGGFILAGLYGFAVLFSALAFVLIDYAMRSAIQKLTD